MKNLTLLFVILFGIHTPSIAQKDTVYVKGYAETGNTIGTLNAAIDSVRETGSISNTVFKLSPNQKYVLNASIVLQKGEHLELVAPKPLRAGKADSETVQQSAPPQILWSNRDIDRQYMIRTWDDVTLKNIWIRHADIDGWQVATGIVFEDDSVETGLDPDKEYGRFDGVLFDYFPIGPEAGGAITVKTDNFVGIFENGYFRNGTDLHFQYYGRAVSFPFQSTGYHIDSLIFENTSFSNLSRIVMMEGGEYVSNLHFNHITVINTLEWPIQSGWWEDVSITNSIFVNINMMGYRPIDVCGRNSGKDIDDFEDGLCNPPGGGIIQDIVPVDSMGFEVDFTEKERQVYIDHNSAYFTSRVLDFYDDVNFYEFGNNRDYQMLKRIPPPSIGDRAQAVYDSVDNQGNKVFPLLNVFPFMEDSAGIMELPVNYGAPYPDYEQGMFLIIYCRFFSGCDSRWAYEPEAGFNQQWLLPENMAYTNEFYQTAAMGGYPLGDLNWYPDILADWEVNQKDNDWAEIESWLNDGKSLVSSEEEPMHIPSSFTLHQNYPNPFNPKTVISYQLPVNSVVNLKVFDVLGREVAELVNGSQVAGQHSVNFDASGFSSGVYIYQLKTEHFVSTKRMLLIK